MMRFWQKILTTAACLAMCLPLQSLERCCCSGVGGTEGSAAKLCCSPLHRSDRIAGKNGCCGTKSSKASVFPTSCGSACCGRQVATCLAEETEETHSQSQRSAGLGESCGLECRCDCGAVLAPSTVARTSEGTDVFIHFAAIAERFSDFVATYQPSSVVSVCERPPIAHNRRQSQLCVWLN